MIWLIEGILVILAAAAAMFIICKAKDCLDQFDRGDK
jgi:hypothetical protein